MFSNYYKRVVNIENKLLVKYVNQDIKKISIRKQTKKSKSKESKQDYSRKYGEHRLYFNDNKLN